MNKNKDNSFLENLLLGAAAIAAIALMKKIADRRKLQAHEQNRGNIALPLSGVNDETHTLGMAWASNPHQDTAIKIVKNFFVGFPEHINMINHERKATSDANSKVPDISFWSTHEENGETVYDYLRIALELTHSKKNTKYSEKSIAMMFRQVPTLGEAFIFNYEEGTWMRRTRYTKWKSGSFSKLLGLDLDILTKSPNFVIANRPKLKQL